MEADEPELQGRRDVQGEGRPEWETDEDPREGFEVSLIFYLHSTNHFNQVYHLLYNPDHS